MLVCLLFSLHPCSRCTPSLCWRDVKQNKPTLTFGTGVIEDAKFKRREALADLAVVVKSAAAK